MKPCTTLCLFILAVFASPVSLQSANSFQSATVNDVVFIKNQLLASINSIAGFDLAPLAKVVAHADPVALGKRIFFYSSIHGLIHRTV